MLVLKSEKIKSVATKNPLQEAGKFLLENDILKIM